MKIAGWEKSSLNAFAGRKAAILFTVGCNFRCYYCYNRPFYVETAPTETIPLEAILAYLKAHRSHLDGVVMSGGEPVIQSGLEGFLEEVKDLGYAIKIETNGSCPKRLARIIEAGLVDYISMDLKAPLPKLRHVIGVALPPAVLEESRALLMESRVDYEFRTVVLPEFLRGDIFSIAEPVKGASRYVLERYKKPETIYSSRSALISRPAQPMSFFNSLALEMHGWFGELILRGMYEEQDDISSDPAFRQAAAM